MRRISLPPAAPGLTAGALHPGILKAAEWIPLSAVQAAARVSVGLVFWKSAMSKLASWPVTEQLFAMEYHVPLIPPSVAAPLATATELGGAILLFAGLFARLGAMALLGLVAVIQIFVFPGNWAEHLLWASLLLLILARGAGAISLDHLVRHRLARIG